MPPAPSQNPANPATPPQSIPLRNLAQTPDSDGGHGHGHHRGRSLLSGGSRPTSWHNNGPRYDRLGDKSPSPTDRVASRPSEAPQSILQTPSFNDEGGTPLSMDDAADFQGAMGFAGLDMPDISLPRAPGAKYPYGSEGDFDGISSFHDAGDDDQPYLIPESDRVPLTDPNHMEPVSGARHSGSRLGDDLQNTEVGLSPQSGRRSRSPSPSTTGALSKAGSMVRAMSQRVVNLSGETGLAEMNARRDQPPHEVDPLATDPNLQAHPSTTSIKKGMRLFAAEQKQPKMPNPLKGRSLCIFSAESKIRNKLCDLLVYPLTEPAILLLIVFQTVLLAIDSSRNVYTQPRPEQWGNTVSDYALLVLFIIFTLEITARIIVSGFILNAPEHSTVNRERGFKAIVLDKYRAVFGPQRRSSIRMPPTSTSSNAPTILRSFTAIHGEAIRTGKEAQRLQLARRAFLRHGFNRLDFVAVVSFWICFILSIVGVEHSYHLYIFRMLSCLRILRLLALTNGTTIILQSFKKATPLLINVSFLIGFFWLLFAIIGVQSFKSSLDRQCVWIDPTDPFNQSGTAYTNVLQYCGGQLNSTTGAHEPWKTGPLDALEPGADRAKGFLCPRGSYCLQLQPDQLPYNGTVSFDNIFQSLELVFVIMTGNTFTDLMYYTTNSDYLAAALFFAGGTMIMTLWLLNLLIAVITSSFHVIREEEKASAFAALLPMEVPELLRRVSKVKGFYDKTYWFWIIAIIYDLVCQASRSAFMSPAQGNFIDNSEVVVTFILLVEIILRFAVDWRGFYKNERNWFDLGLAIITTVILIPPIQNSGQAYAWLTVFQILRIYRVILAVPVTRQLIALVLGNLSGIGNLMLFVFLITFLFSIFAVQLFRGELTPSDPYGNVIHVTFFTLYNTFLGMYQILSSENWTINLYNITAFDTARNTAWMGAIFFIAWFILANFILVNMFIAVIQENFDVSEDEKRMHQVKAFLRRKELRTSSNPSLSALFRLGRSRTMKDPLDYGPATMEMLLKDAVVKDFLDDKVDYSQQAVSTAEAPTHEAPAMNPPPSSSLWSKIVSRVWNREPNPFYSNIRFSPGAGESTDARAMAKEAVSATSQHKRAQREFLARHPNYNTSLFIFKPNNPIRRFCQRIVGPGHGSERFDGVEPNKAVGYAFSVFIYVIIVAMVIVACVTTPLYQREYFDTYTFNSKNWFVWVDIAFAIIFTIEAVIKIIADGCFWTPNAYLRSSWGLIDGIVLISLWINVVTAMLSDGAVSRAVGAFKALRALRLLNVSNSARETFHSLIVVGGWKIFSAALVSLSLLIPFAIYGVNLFNGQMLICNDNTGAIVNLTSDCFGEWNSTPFSNNWNLLAPRAAHNPYYNFDDFGSSLFILFQIVSQEGWLDVMWSAESITGRGLQPAYYASQGNAIFFVIFNIMGTVFVLTLFISVFMRNYTEQTGVAFLTVDQRSWLELRKVLRQVSPSKRPSNMDGQKWKDWCYKRAVRKRGKWQRAITVVLVLHLLLLLVETYPDPGWLDVTRLYIFLAFTVFYMANITVRIIGLGWARFSRSSWDLYSMYTVFGTFVTTILLLANNEADFFVRLRKLFLVSIVLLLIPRNDALDQLFKTAAASLANIGNLLATWFVLFLVFAIALTQAFGLTRFGSQETNNLNFRTVPKALILLFRMSCGEGWNQIMEDFATILPPRCVSDQNFLKSDCGSKIWARVLFVSWNILSSYIFTSMFVSLIFESFSYVYRRSKGLEKVTKEEIRRFKQAWATLDPEGTGFITTESFPRLLGELSGVFAMRIYSHENSVRRILEDIQAEQTNDVGPIATTSTAYSVNLKALNNRLAKINRREVQKARARYNLFFEEVLVSADVNRGISFTTVLIMLAHYNVVGDKSLKLEEFLRRRARLQRVEEEVRRQIVLGFFDTLHWSKRFRKHMERKRAGRMTDIPQLGPEVYVDDEDDITKKATPSKPLLLSPLDVSDPSGSSVIYGSDGIRRRRGTDASLSGSRPFSSSSSPNGSPQLSPHTARNSSSRFEGGELDSSGSGQHNRHGSAVSAENVLEILDNSAWGESIKRSFTIRRPSR